MIDQGTEPQEASRAPDMQPSNHFLTENRTQTTAIRRQLNGSAVDQDMANSLDDFSLESIVESKISRFLDQMGTYFQDNNNLHTLIMKKVEKPLLKQVLMRTGGNQVHASKILGINRNTLRKKIKLYGL